MDRLAPRVVLVLGTVVLIGGVVGVFDGVREDDVDAPIPRLLVMLLVVIAMRRAAIKLRSGNVG